MRSVIPKKRTERQKRARAERLERNEAIRQLDDACKLRVLQRDDWTCQRCGSKRDIQWSHVITREEKRVRWEDDNSKALCRDCHCWWTYHKEEACYWFSKKWPLRWEYINEIVRTSPKVTAANILEMRDGLLQLGLGVLSE